MEDELKINIAGVSDLLTPAKNELHKEITSYGDGILQEAGRLEAASRKRSEEPEITRAFIREAAHLKKREYLNPKKSRWLVACQAVSYFAAFLGGVFANNINTAIGSVLFSITAVVGVVAFFLGKEFK